MTTGSGSSWRPQKAKEATHGGGALSASEAFGHGLAAVLPILGPAAADVGEHFAQGDTAGGVGGMFGLLTPFALKYGLEAKTSGSLMPTKAKIAATNTARADVLTRQANQQVSQRVLAPGNPRYKGTATKIAPELLARDVNVGRFGDARMALQQFADEGMDKAGAAIDAAAQVRTAPMPLKPVIDALNARIDEFHVQGQPIPTAVGRVQALTQLRNYLRTLSRKTGGAISFDELRAIRDDFYDAADKAKGYAMTGGNEHLADMGWAAREGGGAIRQAIADKMPDLAKYNADYTFFKRLADVLDPNLGRPKQTNYVPSGVTGGMSATGAIAGAELLRDLPGVGRFGAVLGSQLLPRLKALVASPAWDLVSAKDKLALANALRKGDVGGARLLIGSFSRYAPRGGTNLAAAPASASQPDSRR